MFYILRDEIGLIPCPEARYNRSPIVLVENKLGVESWCVKFLLPYVHNKLLLYRTRKQWLNRDGKYESYFLLLVFKSDTEYTRKSPCLINANPGWHSWILVLALLFTVSVGANLSVKWVVWTHLYKFYNHSDYMEALKQNFRAPPVTRAVQILSVYLLGSFVRFNLKENNLNVTEEDSSPYRLSLWFLNL